MMDKNPIAFSPFKSDKSELFRFGRTASQLYFSNDSKYTLKVKPGVNGRYFNEFILPPGYGFDEALDPFTELLVVVDAVSAPDLSYHGWPRRNP
ncbi:hypothetical protein N6H13_07430 [Paenibacillus sp. CC-CFT742]|nr:hypothetical protein [Paenibacillus sp. CC-CFT742]WJH30467.1 hypothetical protein N6H13_07430 [Paenibacillus sp. CC-CFT742]